MLGGRAGDLLGRKRLFLIGLVIFTTASFLNGIATTSGMLIGFRALQGLGAALISPAALSIISTTFDEGKERARALAVWAAIAIGGSAVGLVLGGALTQAFSWRWIFFVNVPVGIFAFFAALRLVPESKDEHAHKGYDLAGAVSVTGGLMALVFGLVHAAEHGWGSTWTVVSFVVSAALIVAFVLIEQRSAEPLVRLSIFRVRSLTTANLSMFLAFSGMFAMFFFNTQYIQRALGFGPLKAGVAFLPFTAGIMISAGLASALAPRVGVKPVTAVGMVLTILGLLLFARMPVNGSYASDVLPGMILASLGMGAIFMPLTLVATTGLKNEDQGLASGLFNTSQQVGGALGLAVLTTIAVGHTSDPDVAAGRRSRLAVRLRRRRRLRGPEPRRPARAPAQAGRGTDRVRGQDRRRAGVRQLMTELRADARRNLERVLDAAEQAFGASGPDASIDEIARLAGVGHGTVFRRFPTKDDLMYAVIERHVAQMQALAEEAIVADDPGEAFFDFVWRVAELNMSTAGLHRCVVHCGGKPGAAELEKLAGKIVSRAQRSGAVRQDVEPADVQLLVQSALTSAPPGQWRRYLGVVLDGLRA